MGSTPAQERETSHLVIGVFGDRRNSQAIVERLIEQDFPPDSISLLGHAGGSGDDFLGVYYDNPGQRMKTWGAHGAFWGGLWGLLSGAAGVFVIPGIGAVAAIGPIVESVAGALAGAGIAGGTMAGVAAVSQLAVAIHRMGVPEDRLTWLHECIEQGKYLVIVRSAAPRDAQRWQTEFLWHGAEHAEHFAYRPWAGGDEHIRSDSHD